MSDPFLAEVKIVSFNFAPRGWALCNGQLLSIGQNQALFSLVGTTYGGNGTTNFALPNLQGRTPTHWGNTMALGQSAGEETHTLISSEMPSHTHLVSAASVSGNAPAPTGTVLAAEPTPMYATAGNPVSLAAGTIAPAGGSQAHNNMMPYLTLNFCIALVGIYPSRD